jgi:phospholipase C
MANSLNLIDHIVVLMLENRSFDNMLGWQFGLDPNRFNLTDQGERICVWKNDGTDFATMTIPDPDPGELFTDMTYQGQRLSRPVRGGVAGRRHATRRWSV